MPVDETLDDFDQVEQAYQDGQRVGAGGKPAELRGYGPGGRAGYAARKHTASAITFLAATLANERAPYDARVNAAVALVRIGQNKAATS